MAKHLTRLGLVAATAMFSVLVVLPAIGSEESSPSQAGQTERPNPSDPVVSEGRAQSVEGSTPTSLDELRKLQERSREVVARAIPATVGLTIGSAQGSGVIINSEGLILTAGHVSGRPGQRVTVHLHDGRRVAGRTLGRHSAVDSGMVQITGDLPAGMTEWPHVPLARSSLLRPGDWTIAVGHPGGFQRGRSPVVRLGRVIATRNRVLWTDCTLVGGDSGGPLFDMDGRVIGIHSRISVSTSGNYHVPSDLYIAEWSRLLAGEEIDASSGAESRAFLGITGDDHERGCLVTRVFEDSSAAQAGLRAGDIIVSIGGQAVDSMEQLQERMSTFRPGQRVRIEILRGDQRMTLNARLGDAASMR